MKLALVCVTLFLALLAFLSSSPHASAAEKAAPAQAKLLTIDRSHSYFVAVVRRSGLFGFVGHEHGVLATRWSAKVREDHGNVGASTVEIEVDTATLVVDNEEARRLAALDTGGPDKDDQKKIRDKMLGPDVLDAGKFARISLKSTNVRQLSPSGFMIDADLTLHGVTRPVKVTVGTGVDKDGMSHYEGDLHFKLSDYGIDPPSTAGVINVKDEMSIHFLVVGK